MVLFDTDNLSSDPYRFIFKRVEASLAVIDALLYCKIPLISLGDLKTLIISNIITLFNRMHECMCDIS
ncbi:hypothetical protein [Clostridium beijerinckii]|uniref:hypothetical protein n=1 Tax=Clostridium beijerinckii TaxID=1520 RepID=UPI00232F7A95|nr:hypothetical protein [Clostridium beijerinckii]